MCSLAPRSPLSSAGLALLALVALPSAPAHARGPGHLIVGGDYERGPTAHLDGHAPVVGGGVRVGYGIDAALIELIPEGRVMVWDEPEHDYATAEVGGRVMFLSILEPGVFVRGVLPVGGGGPGLGMHLGALLDLTAIPRLDLGVHAGMILGVKGTSALAGAHVSLNF